jgi:hypothetical protein
MSPAFHLRDGDGDGDGNGDGNGGGDGDNDGDNDNDVPLCFCRVVYGVDCIDVVALVDGVDDGDNVLVLVLMRFLTHTTHIDGGGSGSCGDKLWW